MHLLPLGLLLVLTLGCRSLAPETKQEPVADPVVADAAPQAVTVMQDGQAVWPPTGPGCDRLVACCADGTKLERSVDFFCQLAVAQDQQCEKARGRVRQYLIEKGQPLPRDCEP